MLQEDQNDNESLHLSPPLNAFSRVLITKIFAVVSVLSVIVYSFNTLWIEWWQFPVATRVRLTRENTAKDFDISGYIVPGLKLIHGFGDTLKWWHGTWVGIVPFWRPLTSYGFWFEYRAFGLQRFDEYLVVSILSNVVFCGLLVLFTRKLTGSTLVALLVGILFSGYYALSPLCFDKYFLNVFGSEVGASPCDLCSTSWKNQPDIWSDSAIIGSLILLLDGRWLASLAVACVAVAFKENGWLTFPLMYMLLWARRQLTWGLRKFYVATAASIALLVAVRYASGHAVFVGYHYGGHSGFDEGTVFRYLVSAFQPYPAEFLQHMPSAILATTIFAGNSLRSAKSWIRWSVALSGFAISVYIDAVYNQYTFLPAVFAEFDWDIRLSRMLACLVWLLCVKLLITGTSDKRMVAFLIAAYVLSSLLIVAAVQVQSHVLYLAYAIKCIVAALVVKEVWIMCLRLSRDRSWIQKIRLTQSRLPINSSA